MENAEHLTAVRRMQEYISEHNEPVGAWMPENLRPKMRRAYSLRRKATEGISRLSP
jgi:hypothetical protein